MKLFAKFTASRNMLENAYKNSQRKLKNESIIKSKLLTTDVKLWKNVWLWKKLFLIFQIPPIIITSNNFAKKSWKLHFRYYSYVVIFVCNTDLAIFTSLLFLPFVLGNLFFLSFLSFQFDFIITEFKIFI